MEPKCTLSAGLVKRWKPLRKTHGENRRRHESYHCRDHVKCETIRLIKEIEAPEKCPLYLYTKFEVAVDTQQNGAADERHLATMYFYA
jgi:hypothetical protein